MRDPGAGEGVNLPQLLASFSLATDLGLGQPLEHLLRSWRMADRLGETVGLSHQRRTDLFYVAMLAWVGCVADAPEVAAMFGDDIAFRADSFEVDLAGLSGMGFFLGHAGRGGSWPHRARLAGTIVASGGKAVARGITSHCLSTSTMAAQLGLGDDVSQALRQFFTRWDGRGVPEGVGGEDIAEVVRLFHVANVAEVHARSGGAEAARAVIRSRRGAQFDPRLVDAFLGSSASVLDDVGEAREPDELLPTSPALARPLTDSELDNALTVLADFTDLRCAERAGHSRGVAELAATAAGRLGLPAADVVLVRRAGLVHDIGLHGVPATVLGKAGSLTGDESERIRLAAYYTERVLQRPRALARIGALAALTHERCDCSGYPHGLSGPALSLPGRVLAAACALHAMLEPRSYRPALPLNRAAAALRSEAADGRLDADATEEVLAAAGAARRRRTGGPSGLTPREVEVLILIARGCATKQVASQLDISAKTAGTHIERIYAKTGSSSRATATLFALRHGLIDPLSV
jgi:HD-GYP domain-containing protein (c-di-GMP phosphodiesterase class II)